MGLPIAKITNAALQEMAWKYDRDNSTDLDESEFNEFKSEAKKREDISDEDFKQVMGLYKIHKIKSSDAGDRLEERYNNSKSLIKSCLKKLQARVAN